MEGLFYPALVWCLPAVAIRPTLTSCTATAFKSALASLASPSATLGTALALVATAATALALGWTRGSVSLLVGVSDGIEGHLERIHD